MGVAETNAVSELSTGDAFESMFDYLQGVLLKVTVDILHCTLCRVTVDRCFIAPDLHGVVHKHVVLLLRCRHIVSGVLNNNNVPTWRHTQVAVLMSCALTITC